MKNPTISVVMPVYNGQLYLNEAIESILNQTYSDFEFIIINDGSSDSTESIILSYKDDRIIYLKQLNSGIGFSLKVGCSLAKGKYIARMDADDISYCNRFKSQVDYLDKNPQIILVSSAVRYIDEEGTDIGRSFPYTSHQAMKKILRINSPICHPAVMMRKDAYLASGGYKNVRLLEDFLLWVTLSRYGKLHNIPTTLLKYRVLENSVSHSIPPNENRKLLQFILKNINNGNGNEDYIEEYQRKYEELKTRIVVSTKTQVKRDKTLKQYPPSKIERSLYHFLTKLNLSESVIEILICTLKNYFILFTRTKSL